MLSISLPESLRIGELVVSSDRAMPMPFPVFDISKFTDTLHA